MRDDFDFHAGAFGEGGDLHRGARGEFFREMFGIDFVHGGKVGEVGEKHGAFHNVGKGQSLVVQNGLHVLERPLGLRLDVAGDQVAVLGINRDLAGAEQEVAHAHGVAVRADGGR